MRQGRPLRARRRRYDKKLLFLIVLLSLLLILLILLMIGIWHKTSKSQKTKETTTEENIDNKEKSTKKADTATTTVQEETTLPYPTASETEKEQWYLKLVNPTHSLLADPEIELEVLKNGYKVDKRISEDLQAMFDDCRAAGLEPLICSAYRTMEYQQKLYDKTVEQYKAKGYDDVKAKELAAMDTAIPGTSEHQLGLAVDIVSIQNQRLEEAQESTPEQIWLMQNCYKYGFILRFPKGKENLTGIMYEPWHYRYVGKEAAKEIYEADITLEEYLGELN